MSNLEIFMACENSDRTRPLIDGRVQVEGVELHWLPIDPEETFHRAFRHEEFDVCELSMASHITATSRDGSPYVAIPVFPSRAFRHGAIFIRKDRGINEAGDLAGRTVGVPDYQQTAALWVRGMLLDEHGVDASNVAWRVGGLEEAGRLPRSLIGLPARLSVEPIPANATLSRMLADGTLDAVVSPRVPSAVQEASASVGPLYPNPREVEELYFATSGFFPIMHTVGIRRELAERHPWLATALTKAFEQAKQLALDDLAQVNYARATLPWVRDELQRVQAVMGMDFWPYGFERNVATLRAMCRYAYADGLAPRLVDPEELFSPQTLAMFRL